MSADTSWALLRKLASGAVWLAAVALLGYHLASVQRQGAFAMQTNEHKLKIELVRGVLVASCACRHWRRERSLDDAAWVLPVALPLLEYWEEEHVRHVSRCMAPEPDAACL